MPVHHVNSGQLDFVKCREVTCDAGSDLCEYCRMCHNHCGCQFCARCGNYQGRQPVCPRCSECADCCDCSHCEGCNHVTEDLCSNNLCHACCGPDCEHENNITFIEPLEKPLFRKAETFTLNPSKRYLSVEIEVGGTDTGRNTNTAKVVDKWGGAIVEDGSLPHGGFEINTAPANGDAFIKQISEITQALSEDGADVNDSCGLHVHVDARNFRSPDMRRLLKLYAKIEPALFALVPPSRRESTYCAPCAGNYLAHIAKALDAKTTREQLAQVVYYKKIVTKSMRSNKHGGERYLALNLVSWYYRGTVECRLFNGTVNFTKITGWAMLWAAILDYASRYCEKYIENLPDFNYDNPTMLLERIAPNQTVRDFVKARYKVHGKKGGMIRAFKVEGGKITGYEKQRGDYE